jgi:hypothetical protein
MRTTLTLDDSLVRVLKRIAGQRGESFKTVVNEALRAGIGGIGGQSSRAPYRTRTRSFTILPGHDPYKLGQIADEVDDMLKMGRRR